MNKLLLILFTCVVSNGFAQTGINNLWLSGYQSQYGYPNGNFKMDFISGSLTITSDSLPMSFAVTHSNISDTIGNLLFYTNGIYIADASNDTMANGSELNPSAYTTTYHDEGLVIPQADLIIPKPGSSSIYYMFHGTIDNDVDIYASYLYLTTIDMSLNNGLGAVVSKNIIKIQDTLNIGKITGCKHANGRDWWVFCHKAYSNTFYSLLITPDSIMGPYQQSIGIIRPPDIGQLIFSPDGNRITYYYPIGDLEVFDYDRCTGIISNPRFASINDSAFGGGCAFSPNSNVLYVSSSNYVYQFDVTTANLATSQTTVAVWDSFASYIPSWGYWETFFNLSALAPDGKIYITTGNSTIHIHVINNPDSLGASCNLVQHAIQVPYFYYNTLPNHPNYFLGADTTSACDTVHVGLAETRPSGAGGLKVFPNPTDGKFTLWFNVHDKLGLVQVYDVNGNLILQEPVAQWSQYKHIDISNQPTGIYFVKIQWNKSSGSAKVIKR